MRWSAADLRGTAAAIEPWWRLLTQDVPPEVVREVVPHAVARWIGPAAPDSAPAPDEVAAALMSLSAAGRELALRGHRAATGRGHVAGLFAGDGGVPKRPVPSAEVGSGGMVGDRQRTRKHHGRVWQALCLWSAEVIDVLRGEGHGVFPGACGENVVVAGVDWSTLRPGTRLRIGTVLAEVSLPTVPCRQIRPFFDGSIRRVDHDRHPGSSRWYASVITGGVLAAGDVVVVEPEF